MQTKEKRKTNPRRRLLMRLVLGIVTIGIVTVLGLRALQPTGAQIVYIAPDDNGYDAIWLADLNDPEHPRQLTHHEGHDVFNIQVSEENRIIFYTISTRYFSSIPQPWSINLDTGENHRLPLCDTDSCGYFELHPSGEWIAYQEYDGFVKVIVQNLEHQLEKSERREIFEINFDSFSPNYPLPQWIGTTDRLVFRTSGDNEVDEFAFYSIEENQIVETESLNVPFLTPNFSDDSSLFIHFTYYMADHPNPMSIRYTDNSANAIYETDSTTLFLDWHPNNEIVLFSEFLLSNDLSNPNPFGLNLYNLVTGEKETLSNELGSLYVPSSFNYDGTQVLSSNDIYNEDLDEIVIHDLETREEITLPIVGRNPQWVNGGR